MLNSGSSSKKLPSSSRKSSTTKLSRGATTERGDHEPASGQKVRVLFPADDFSADDKENNVESTHQPANSVDQGNKLTITGSKRVLQDIGNTHADMRNPSSAKRARPADANKARPADANKHQAIVLADAPQVSGTSTRTPVAAFQIPVDPFSRGHRVSIQLESLNELFRDQTSPGIISPASTLSRCSVFDLRSAPAPFRLAKKTVSTASCSSQISLHSLPPIPQGICGCCGTGRRVT